MSELILKTRQDIEDIVRGFTFYATGGGGLPKNGLQSLMSEFDAGREIILSDVDSLPDDAVTACPFLMGSIAPHTVEVLKEMQGFGFTESVNTEKDRMRKAVEELEEYTGKTIDAIVPIELAGANTSAAIAAAIELGKIVLNGDYTGRAIPEIQQTTPYLNDKKITPISSVDEWGNTCFIKEASNYRVAERIGKLISAGAYGLAGQAGFLLNGKETKEVIIPNTLEESYTLGKLIRESNEQGKNPIEETIKALRGWRIFQGQITIKDDEDRIGYYWGTYTIEGQEDFSGKTAKVWFKNENHMCWIEDEPVVTSPDIIVIVDSKTGEPVPNPLSELGQNVSILAFESRPQFKNPKGIDILGPRYFGFNVDYKPIETVMSR
ncbi:MAG: DUF917 domain-containing protein [SAR324 cluster bacterium]|nr:DUF917 domain-containing protein [SAR324 cluster bacterium]